MPFVQMAYLRMEPELLQEAPATDAQENLLFEPEL
jgi:hypothetical protein